MLQTLEETLLITITNYIDRDDLIHVRRTCSNLNTKLASYAQKREWNHIDIHMKHHRHTGPELTKYYGPCEFPGNLVPDAFDTSTMRNCIQLHNDVDIADFVQYVYDGLIDNDKLACVESISFRGPAYFPDYQADFDKNIVNDRNCKAANEFSTVALLLLSLGPMIFKNLKSISIASEFDPGVTVPFLGMMLEKYPAAEKHLRLIADGICITKRNKNRCPSMLDKVETIRSLRLHGVDFDDFRSQIGGIERIEAINSNLVSVMNAKASKLSTLKSLKVRDDDLAWTTLTKLRALEQLDIVDLELQIDGKIELPGLSSLILHTCAGKFLDCCSLPALKFLEVHTINSPTDTIAYEDEIVPALSHKILLSDKLQQVAVFGFTAYSVAQMFQQKYKPHQLDAVVAARIITRLSDADSLMSTLHKLAVPYIYIGTVKEIPSEVLEELSEFATYIESRNLKPSGFLELVDVEKEWGGGLIPTPHTLIRTKIHCPVYRVRK